MEQKRNCRPPIFTGEIIGDDVKDVDITLTNSRYDGQPLQIWQLPDCLKAAYRYIVCVRFFATSQGFEHSVITVTDRFSMIKNMGGGKLKVVARWHDHTSIEKVALAGAQLAKYYDDALLVFISNEVESYVERVIIDNISYIYPNLYVRESRVDMSTKKIIPIYGFEINPYKKKIVYNKYNECAEADLIDNPVDMNGANVDLSTAVGIYISLIMPRPYFVKTGENINQFTSRLNKKQRMSNMEQKDIKLSEEEKAYIRELLRETQPLFREIVRVREQRLEYMVPKQGELVSLPSDLVHGKETQSSCLSDEFWALRSGDLRPEKIEHMGFSQRFCKILEKDGLLFKSQDEAEDASVKARAAIQGLKVTRLK